MKDPSRSSTSPSIINEDVIINGHSHEDDNPFAEYMWMENEEEFNRQIEEELWEEEFIERCFQEMLEEEEEHEWVYSSSRSPTNYGPNPRPFNDLVISDGSSLEDLVVKSNLNPNAKEFVPGVKYLFWVIRDLGTGCQPTSNSLFYIQFYFMALLSYAFLEFVGLRIEKPYSQSVHILVGDPLVCPNAPVLLIATLKDNKQVGLLFFCKLQHLAGSVGRAYNS
uniref:Polyadenylate-binding protein-interacting protein 2 n=1 Tax=Lynx canadensis TaxID=61383 RepID=A0A667GKS0_LYNCA